MRKHQAKSAFKGIQKFWQIKFLNPPDNVVRQLAEQQLSYISDFLGFSALQQWSPWFLGDNELLENVKQRITRTKSVYPS